MVGEEGRGGGMLIVWLCGGEADWVIGRGEKGCGGSMDA